MLKNVQKCSKMFKNVEKRSNPKFKNVQKRIKKVHLFYSAPKNVEKVRKNFKMFTTKMFKNVHKDSNCHEKFKNVQKCSKMLKNVPNVPKCSKMFENVLKC